MSYLLPYTGQEVQYQLEGCNANIYVENESATAQSIATGASYVKVTGFANDGPSSNCTADSANDKITITIAGTYHVDASVNFTGSVNNINWFGAAFLDGVEQPQCHFERKLGTAGDYGSASISGDIVVSSVPVDLDLRVRHNGATQNFTMTYGSINVNRLGVE